MIMQKPDNISKATIWNILDTVVDPEIPVLSVVDMGIIRDIQLMPGEGHDTPGVEVSITPTYTGCPAMDVISTGIRLALIEHGFTRNTIKTILAPAWTTDWMTESGKQKLKAYGIAPPQTKSGAPSLNEKDSEVKVQCPQCNSYNTKRISQFGSTACKSLYQCEDCKEPFDYFKCH